MRPCLTSLIAPVFLNLNEMNIKNDVTASCMMLNIYMMLEDGAYDTLGKDPYAIIGAYIDMDVEYLKIGFEGAYYLKKGLRDEKATFFKKREPDNYVDLRWWGSKLHVATAFCLANCLDEFDGSPLGLVMLLPKPLVPTTYDEDQFQFEAIRNARKWCKLYGYRIDKIYQRVAAKVASKGVIKV